MEREVEIVNRLGLHARAAARLVHTASGFASRTLLVKDARTRNCTVITGVEMFVRQAMLQFFLFTGKEASPELMRDVLKRAIGPLGGGL